MANKKYVSLNRLSDFLDNLKNTFLKKSDYVVDSALSSTSSNPVANSVLNAEFEEIAHAMNIYGLAIDDKADKSEVDSELSAINTSIANIKSGDVVVKEAEHSTSADSATTATSANSATKATQDASGNVITSTYETKSDASKKLTEAKTYTDTKTSGLASTSSVTSSISTHNTSTTAHSDIRELITNLTTRLNALANSTDEDLDQMAEIVAYIKSNKSLIDSITTSKINVSDIVNNLTTNSTSKVLSAAQGVAIKALIDALQTEVDGKADSGHSHTITASASDDDVIVLTGTNGTNKVTYSASHANSGVTAGTYKSVTVNAKGHVTSGSNPTTLSGYGITDAYTKTQVDSTVSTLNTAISGKAASSHNHSASEITSGTMSVDRLPNGTTSAKGVVQLTNSTSSTSTTTAATPSSVKSAYDLANTAKTNAATAQTRADSAYSLAGQKCQVQIITWGADD